MVRTNIIFTKLVNISVMVKFWFEFVRSEFKILSATYCITYLRQMVSLTLGLWSHLILLTCYLYIIALVDTNILSVFLEILHVLDKRSCGDIIHRAHGFKTSNYTMCDDIWYLHLHLQRDEWLLFIINNFSIYFWFWLYVNNIF